VRKKDQGTLNQNLGGELGSCVMGGGLSLYFGDDVSVFDTVYCSYKEFCFYHIFGADFGRLLYVWLDMNCLSS